MTSLSLILLSHGLVNPGRTRVRPGLTRSHASTEASRTRVNTPGSTLVASRVEPGYEGVEAS